MLWNRHDSVQGKFVFGGSRLLDLKPYILLGAKFKENYMIVTGLSLTLESPSDQRCF